MAESRHRLRLGSFVASDGTSPVRSPHGYTVETLGEGFSTGNPVPVVSAVSSLLADGALASITGYDNRTDATFRVTFTGDSVSLARGEADLSAAVHGVDGRGRNELIWEVPDGKSPPTVFDVLVARMDRAEAGVEADLDEVMHLRRTWLVTLTCLPWARSDTPVVETLSASVSPTRTTLNACDSTAGWSGSPVTVVSIDGRTALRVGPSGPYAVGAKHALTGLSFQRYVSVDLRLEQSTDTVVATMAGQARYPEVVESLTDGWSRYYFDGRVGNSTGFDVAVSRNAAPTLQFWMDSVATQPSIAALSPKQVMWSVDNRGSERAPVSFQLSHAATALGDVLACTWRDRGDGFTPGLRKYRVSGGTVTSDTARISGASEPLSVAVASSFKARIPMRTLRPGAYEVFYVGSATSATSISATFTNTTTSEGYTLNPVLDVVSPPLFRSLGQVLLPHVPSPPEASGFLDVYVYGQGTMDELLLVPVDDDTATTLITSASAGRNLWLESPSLMQPRGAVWSGTANDKSDASSLSHRAKPAGRHYLSADRTQVFLACSGPATPPTLTSTYYPTFHSHALPTDAA